MHKRNNVFLIRILEVCIAVVLGILIFMLLQGTPRAYQDNATSRDLSMPIGAQSAPIMQIYIDFSCVHCQSFFKESYPLIKKKYIDTGKLQVHFKDLPATGGDDLYLLHQVPHCAQTQGKYEETLNIMISNEMFGKYDLILARVKGIVADPEDLEQCIQERRHDYSLITARREARALGISSTPAFVLGDVIVKGNQPYEVIDASIDEYLTKVVE